MTTPNLALPYLAAAQAQKHVTVNEALDALDALVQLSVISAALAAPPGSPAEGDRYIAASGAAGAWAGWDASAAQFSGGAWHRLIPQTGWLAWNEANGVVLVWTGSAWTGLDVAMGLLARAFSVRVQKVQPGLQATWWWPKNCSRSCPGPRSPRPLQYPTAPSFLGFGFYPRQNFLHIDIGRARQWGNPFPPRATRSGRTTRFAPGPPRLRESLTESRTMKGGGAAGLATIGAAGIEMLQDVLAETQSAILPLVPYLDT